MERYITIQEFMRRDLGLKGNELIVYALIYGFAQDGENAFNGSINYIAKWTGASRQTTIRILAELEKKDLIYKKQFTKNNILYNAYYCRIAGGSQILIPPQAGGSQILIPPQSNFDTPTYINNNNNNIHHNNKAKDKKEKENFLESVEKNSTWRETVQMNLKIKDFAAAWDDFKKLCDMTGKEHQSESDVKTHFVYWYKKHKEQGGGGAKTTNTQTLTKTQNVW
jgi:hypothetical protein